MRYYQIQLNFSTVFHHNIKKTVILILKNKISNEIINPEHNRSNTGDIGLVSISPNENSFSGVVMFDNNLCLHSLIHQSVKKNYPTAKKCCSQILHYIKAIDI